MTTVECDACGEGFDPSEDDKASVQRDRDTGEIVLASCGSCVRKAGAKADAHADPVKRGDERA